MTACPAATVSDAAARQLCDQLGFDGSRVAVIPNGVDLEEFAPRNVARRRQARSLLNLAEEDFLIGTVGSLTPVKGHSVLFAAFARLAAGLGNAKLVLIGDGPLRTMLAEQAQQLGIASRVVFAGSWRDVSRVLPALDLYVSSSLAEGCSNAVLEAMATALPCVVTDVSDQGRLVAGVDPGLVVPSGDVAALGRILEYLATRRDRAVEIGRRHRLLIEDRYDFTRTVAEYESLYDRLIKGPTPAGGICDERTE